MSFWINNPTILFDVSYVTELWPYSYMTRDEKLNAMTRFIILVSIIGYICINRFIIIVFGLIVIGVIVLLYTNKKEGMMSYFNISEKSDIQSNNPFSNVLISDYKSNPNKPEFKEEYTPDLENRLNNSIPNTQDKFLEFCFGTLPSEKPLTIY